MNEILKVFLSMSVSGGLLILVLLLGKRFWRDRLNRQWQYYIWLAVILRLLLPFGPEVNLLGRTYQAVGQAITTPLTQQVVQDPSEDRPAAGVAEEIPESPVQPSAAAHPLREFGTQLVNHIWLIWLVAALGLLIRKITIYQGFVRYIRAGSVPVSDIALLDRLSVVGEQAGVGRPLELCVNPLVSSPLLTGFFHPCIVLPSEDVSETDFQYIILHELTHYRRGDMFYKWLVQVTICLHWFNPLVYLMGREIAKACEFSCDEAVLLAIGDDRAQDYGKTLLNAMAAVGTYRENPGAVTLSENKQLLKERLGAIMNFKRKSPAVRLLTAALTLCVILGATFVGVYPAGAANLPSDVPTVSGNKKSSREKTGGKDSDSQAERYYEAGSLPLFEIAFSRLDEAAQEKWLEKLYGEDDFMFFSAAVNRLDETSPLPARFAEKAYNDGEIAFFSTLTDRMGEAELERWLDRALEDEDRDESWAFQSMLFNKLDRDEEYDELEEKKEKEWEEAQRAAYQAVGVTMDGKDYYYKGKLVNIFLDMRHNKSFYTLNLNPKGTVNIRIVRNADNNITGAAYLTDAEVAELLEDMWDDDDDSSEAASIPVSLKTVAAGECVALGKYTLSDGDRIQYDISAETGRGMQVYFAKDQRQDTVYWSVHNLRQKGEELRCALDTTVSPPAKAGTYKLYLKATDGALGNVKGSISIGFAGE